MGVSHIQLPADPEDFKNKISLFDMKYPTLFKAILI